MVHLSSLRLSFFALPLCVVLVCLSAQTCHRPDAVARQLDAADRLIDKHPRQGDSLLQTQRHDTALWSTENRMHFVWLSAKAHVRCGRSVARLTPALQRATRYYQDHGNESGLQRALLYLGNSLRDSNRYADALRCFRQASVPHGGRADSAVAADALMNQARLYAYLFCGQQAETLATCAVNMAQATGSLRAIHLGALAEAHYASGLQNKARACALRGYTLLRRETPQAPVLELYAILLTDMGDSLRALECLKRLEAMPRQDAPSNTLANVRQAYYARFAQPDTALHYAHICLKRSVTVGDSIRACGTIIRACMATKRYADAATYTNLLTGLRSRESREVSRLFSEKAAPADINFYQKTAPLGQAPRSAYSGRLWLGAVGAFLFLGIAGIFVVLRYRRKHALWRRAQSTAVLPDKAPHGHDIPPANPQVKAAMAKLKARNESQESPLSDAEWQTLIAWADKVYPDYGKRFRQARLGNKPIMQRMVYLVLFGFKDSEIVRILHAPRSTTYDRLKRIKKHLKLN